MIASSARSIAVTPVLVAIIGLVALPAAAQTGAASAPAYTPPRTANGSPDLQGIWQAVNSASDDIESHPALKGVTAGLSVVEGNVIPYQPSAAARKKENFENRLTADPLTKCVMPGVPRITYLPYPFQILEFPDLVVMVYEYLHLTRYIFMDGSPAPDPDVVDFYMGYSRGRWEGNTLVVETTNNNSETWFDRAGNFHSDALRVTERYTRTGPDHIAYAVTIEDPKVFTRPWKINMPLYRRQETGLRLLEYECYVYREEELGQAEAAAEGAKGK